MEHSAPTPVTVAQLSQWFGFALEDLALNRAGKLSPRQRQTLRYDAAGQLIRGCAALVLGIILTATVAPAAETLLERTLLVAVLAGVLVLALMLAHAFVRALRPTVRRVTGPLRRADDPWHPAIVVGSEPLRISTRRWKRLPAALPGTYCAYVDPSGRLLSLEPFGNADDP